jgi:hypothetical protein
MNVEQHHQAGTDLLAVDRELVRLSAIISRAYGYTSAERKSLDRARKALLMARSELENRYCRENPGAIDACHVYFGSDEPRQHFGVVAKTSHLL